MYTNAAALSANENGCFADSDDEKSAHTTIPSQTTTTGNMGGLNKSADSVNRIVSPRATATASGRQHSSHEQSAGEVTDIRDRGQQHAHKKRGEVDDDNTVLQVERTLAFTVPVATVESPSTGSCADNVATFTSQAPTITVVPSVGSATQDSAVSPIHAAHPNTVSNMSFGMGTNTGTSQTDGITPRNDVQQSVTASGQSANNVSASQNQELASLADAVSQLTSLVAQQQQQLKDQLMLQQQQQQQHQEQQQQQQQQQPLPQQQASSLSLQDATMEIAAHALLAAAIASPPQSPLKRLLNRPNAPSRSALSPNKGIGSLNPKAGQQRQHMRSPV